MNLLVKSITGLAILLISASVIWSFQPRNLPIWQVSVEGELKHLATEDLRIAIGTAIEGGFFNTDISAIRSILLSHPWVRDVSVRRVWPDRLRVLVIERQAVAFWRETGLLDSNGIYFAPQKSSWPINLPRLEGPDGTELLLLKRYRELQQRLSIARLSLNARGAWKIELNNGVNILLGKNQFEERVARFTESIATYMQKQLPQVEQIDMRYTNGFAVRWKQALKQKSGTQQL